MTRPIASEGSSEASEAASEASEGSPVRRAPQLPASRAPASRPAPVRAPEWAPWWICYEAGRSGSPWVLRTYRQSDRDTRQRGYFGRKEAVRRLGRLRVLWGKWTFIATIRLIPEHKWDEGFTEAEYAEAGVELEGRRRVRLALLDIRRMAVKCGLDPDEVAYQRGDRLFAGRLLLENRADVDRLLAGQQTQPPTVQLGQQWQPLDVRRKRPLTIQRIEADHVVATDGRHVLTRRLLTRYRPLP